MIVLRFRVTMTMPDESDAAMVAAARRLLMQLAAEIVQASAKWNGDGGSAPARR